MNARRALHERCRKPHAIFIYPRNNGRNFRSQGRSDACARRRAHSPALGRYHAGTRPRATVDQAKPQRLAEVGRALAQPLYEPQEEDEELFVRRKALAPSDNRRSCEARHLPAAKVRIQIGHSPNLKKASTTQLVSLRRGRADPSSRVRQDLSNKRLFVCLSVCLSLSLSRARARTLSPPFSPSPPPRS